VGIVNTLNVDSSNLAIFAHIVSPLFVTIKFSFILIFPHQQLIIININDMKIGENSILATSKVNQGFSLIC